MGELGEADQRKDAKVQRVRKGESFRAGDWVYFEPENRVQRFVRLMLRRPRRVRKIAR